MCSEGCEGVRLSLSSCVEILVESDPNVSERVFERSDRLGFRDGCRLGSVWSQEVVWFWCFVEFVFIGWLTYKRRQEEAVVIE